MKTDSKLELQLPSITDENPIAGSRITLEPGLKFQSFYPKSPLILFVEEGSLNIVVKIEEFHLGNGSLIVLHPHTLISSLSTETEVKLRVIAYHASLLSMMLMDFTEYLPSLIKSDTKGILKLLPDEISNMEKWFDLLESQANLPSSWKSYKVADHLITAFHLQLLEIATGESVESQRRRSRQQELMGNFLIALGKNVRKERSVHFYASLLCVTPKHLSATIKEIAGQTASQFINRHVIMEAQVLLRTSTLTIQQLSALLNFPNQSFFGKYFKKHTGLSPKSYRNQNRSPAP